MKKIVMIGMLLSSLLQDSVAQVKPSPTSMEKIFDEPFQNFNRRYLLDMGKGNKAQVEISEIKDLQIFINADSLLKIFIRDIQPLRDSLSQESGNVRIDYLLDSSGVNKIRFHQYQRPEKGFVSDHGEFAALKTEQDTFYIGGTIRYMAKVFGRKPFELRRPYRLGIFINRYEELPGLMEGRVAAKIQELISRHNSMWKQKGGHYFLEADPAISSKQPDGYFSGPGDYLELNAGVNIENYKNFFTPSVTLGAKLILANTFFKREIGLFWEPHFNFGSDLSGKPKIFRNDFLTLSFGQGPTRENDPRKPSYLITILSLGYLINRNGEYFDKNTFRLMGGRLSLVDGKVNIEPALYFHDLFKGTTPSIRFSLAF